MMTDPIADMFTRIRNASKVHKKEVVVPYSNIKRAIADILVKEGYLEHAEKTADKKAELILKLKYKNGEPVVHQLKRISKPGHRRYVKNDEAVKVLNGFGLAIVSTPKGVMTGPEARRAKVGGELLCEVY